MTYLVTRHTDAIDFLAAVEPFLLQEEALNSLILGVVRAQQRGGRPRRRRAPLYLTVAAQGPVLAGLSSTGASLLLAGSNPANEAIVALVAELSSTPAAVPMVLAEATLARRFAERWAVATGRAPALRSRQTLFELSAVTFPPPVEGRLRPAIVLDSELLSGWLMAFWQETGHHDAGDPDPDPDAARLIVDGLLARKDLFVWQVGEGTEARPVAMAAQARPGQQGTAINLVYVPPEARGRGYAAACVAHLSQWLLDNHWRFVTLFADHADRSAQALYARIGFRPLAEFCEYRFTAPNAVEGES